MIRTIRARKIQREKVEETRWGGRGKGKEKQNKSKKCKDIIKERNREKVKQKEKICPHIHKIIQ